MKPPIYFAIIRRWNEGSGFAILHVTSEKHGQMYGRIGDDGGVTHVTMADRVGKRLTLAEATAAFEAARRVRERYQPFVDEARKALQVAENKLVEQMRFAMSGTVVPS